MKKYLLPLVILFSMLLASLFYYADVIDGFQLKSTLTICTVLWFVGLFVREKILNSKS